jgi:small GTP-binding protein
MSRSDVPRLSFKAVLLGDSGVGKTSLVTRWTTGAFSRSANPTVGASHQRKRLTLEGHDVDLFLWDTAGQEQFQALTPLYARSSSVAILTTSLSEPTSFDNIERWISLLQSATDEIPPVILAVNKIDLIDSAFKSIEEIQQEYGKRFAAVFFVSAVTNEEVDNLFMFAALAGYRFAKAAGPETHRTVLGERDEAQEKCC